MAGPFTRQIKPPRTGDLREIQRWQELVYKILSGTPGIEWSVLDKTGSNLTDIETRNHNDLQNRDTASAHPASSITNTPHGQISATEVQAALDELEDEKFPYLAPLTIVTADYTITAANSTILANCTGGNITVTLPTADGIGGRSYTIKHIGTANTVTIDGNGSETIDGSTALTIIFQHDSVTVQSDGTNWQII